jgi:hypothetical protein
LNYFEAKSNLTNISKYQIIEIANKLVCPMDPQTQNNLDPKLKETYDRVMGTTTAPAGGQPAAAAPSTPPPAAPTPAAPVDANAGTPPAADASQNTGSSIPQTPYTADNLSFQAAIQTPVNTQVPLGGMVAPRQSSSLLRILYIVGGVVFFVVYTFVWVKIFNLPLPFLE